MRPQAKVVLSSLFLGLGPLGALSGCAGREGSFLTVQLCLKDDRGVSDFFSSMRQIAAENEMKFLDKSEETRADFDAIEKAGGPRRPRGPVIQLTVQNARGVGVTATNLGLPPYQVALGFFADRDAPGGRQFASSTIRQLSTRWLYRVPNERGALPLPGCRT
jgi:hypothetical protein